LEDGPDFAAKGDEEGEEGAEVDYFDKDMVVEAAREEVLGKGEVAAGAHGDELGEALNYAVNDCEPKCHGYIIA